MPGIDNIMENPFRMETMLEYLAEHPDKRFAARAAHNVCSTLENKMDKWGETNRKFYNKLLNTAEYLAAKTTLSSFPSRMYLELTNACNLDCPMCGQSFFRGKRALLDPRVVNKLEPIYPYLDDLCLAGFGETLIHPHLKEIIYAIPSYVPTRIITNGLPLHEEIIDFLTGNLHSLWVSFEATDPETYQKIRGVDAYHRLLDQIRQLQETKERRGTDLPRLFFCFVAMQRNIHQLPAYIEQASKLGAEGVHVNFLTVFRDSLKEQSLYFDREKAEEYFEKARHVARSCNIELTLPSDNGSGGSSFFRCAEPWQFSYVSATGDIIPCCVYTYPLGNIYSTSFSKIWNNEAYQTFRHSVNSPRSRHQRCRRCIIDANRTRWDENRHFQLIDKKNRLIEEKQDA